MSEISRISLFGKLNPILYKAVEGATVFCKLRGNPYVELVHWLQQIAQLQDSDLHRIIRHYELDESKIAADIQRSLDGLPRGATVISDLSAHIENAIERAWVYGTLLYGDAQVRSGYVVVGILKTLGLRAVLIGISSEFSKLAVDAVADELPQVVKGSPEDTLAASDQSNLGGEPGEASGAMAPQMGKQEALKKYAVDLTAKARAGELDPISGRDLEIRQIVDILMRRRQNNPLLTGEAGVGKTAVVEGFASRLARGDVPPALKDVSLLTLDIGLLQAGASMKGEFEQRLRQVIDEVQASPKPIILFVDEVHTLVGAGGAAGTGDAANLLKPALARGTLRTIGATTWSEYKKYIEKDPALTRRFQVVQVAEPDEAKAIIMLRGVATVLEKHHRVQLLDEAIGAAVRLSHRYIPARQLPDKAVSLLDTACARVAVSQHAIPAQVEDCNRRIEALTIELEIIDREIAVGIDVGSRKTDASERISVERANLVVLQARWDEEKKVVDRILEIRAHLRSMSDGAVDATAAPVANVAAPVANVAAPVANAAAASDATPAASGNGTDTTAPAARDPKEIEAERQTLLAELKVLQPQLADIQKDSPLVLPSVDEQAVGAVVADWTGIPVGRMVKNEVAAVLALTDTLNARVIGQRGGLEMISRRVQTSRAKLDNPNKPIGVFLLCGPSGVGKTETALTLAEALYGGEQNVITINMSEFQEAHTVSTLKGAPPGYVGYGEGGVLTEAVRRRPYSVVLLDEVEKAHPDVHEIFFQVFDKGWMEDGEGRYIDFKNTVIILTSNVGTDAIVAACTDPDLIPDEEALAKTLREPLLKVFPPALLGRVVTVPYYPLSDAMLASIVSLQLSRIQKRILENHDAKFSYDESAVKLIISRCTEVESGGRMIDAVLTNAVLPRISSEYLQRIVDGKTLSSIKLSAHENQFVFEFE
jgi:type VI secretion system protein VasG